MQKGTCTSVLLQYFVACLRPALVPRDKGLWLGSKCCSGIEGGLLVLGGKTLTAMLSSHCSYTPTDCEASLTLDYRVKVVTIGVAQIMVTPDLAVCVKWQDWSRIDSLHDRPADSP
jgi:hypothetical protein